MKAIRCRKTKGVTMDDRLDKTLGAISRYYGNQIAKTSRFYMEVDIGRHAGELGYTDLEQKYRAVQAVIPLKRARRGMKVRIDGRTFVNYGQLESGVVVPGHVIKNSSLSYRDYLPKGSMVLNFA
jgi:hypothetical protein